MGIRLRWAYACMCACQSKNITDIARTTIQMYSHRTTLNGSAFTEQWNEIEIEIDRYIDERKLVVTWQSVTTTHLCSVRC